MQDPETTRPGAAPAATDGESGSDHGTAEGDLRALQVMLDRGLMSQAEFDQRRAEITAAAPGHRA